MQNPKTGGNRFNPDIRPSEIDTYTETNGEQTAEYKIINAHPIINGILNKLAFFRTHAAAVYYNRLANKTVKQKFDDVDAAVGELNEKLIPCEFAVPNGSDINDEKYRKFGFYSGQRLLNAPTNAWFQWLTFPLNNNPEYPVQLGFWVDNHSGDVRMYTRALTDVSGAHAWKNWVEIATKLYVDDRKANIVRKGWSPSITLDKPHGTITVSYRDLYIVWVSGNPGTYEFHIKSITGGELNIVSFSQETGIVTLATKSGNNSAFTYVGA